METPCCVYSDTCKAAFKVYPSDGKWSLQKQYEIMRDCEELPSLKGVYPMAVCEGGFAWKPIDQDPNSNEAIELERIRQIRTYGLERAPWINQEDETDWQETLPLREDFEDEISFSATYFRGSTSVPCIYLRAKNSPSLQMVVDLMMVFERRGHLILETEDFKVSADGQVKITTGKSHSKVTAAQIREMSLSSSNGGWIQLGTKTIGEFTKGYPGIRVLNCDY